MTRGDFVYIPRYNCHAVVDFVGPATVIVKELSVDLDPTPGGSGSTVSFTRNWWVRLADVVELTPPPEPLHAA